MLHHTSIFTEPPRYSGSALILIPFVDDMVAWVRTIAPIWASGPRPKQRVREWGPEQVPQQRALRARGGQLCGQQQRPARGVRRGQHQR